MLKLGRLGIIVILGSGLVLGLVTIFYFGGDSQAKLESSLSEVPYLTTNLPASTNKLNQRLARFWAQTAYDPVLALPGVDTVELRLVADALASGQSRYLHHYEGYDQQLVAELIHPFAFLNDLPELEDSRRLFLKEPSYRAALSYSWQQYRTLWELGRYSLEVSDLFHSFDNESTVYSPAGLTTNHYFSLQLAEVHLVSELQMKVVKNRLWCLLGLRSGGDCLVDFPEVKSHNVIPTLNQSTIDNLMAHGRALKTYWHKEPNHFLSLTEVTSNDLPLVYLPEARCTSDLSAAYLFSWRPSRVSGLTSLWSTTVNEILFHDVSRLSTPVYEEMAEAGVRYEYQPLNLYLCVDAGHDLATVRTAYYLQNQLQKTPLLSQYQGSELPATWRQAAVLETAVVDATDILDVSLVDVYVEELSNIFFNYEMSSSELSDLEWSRWLSILNLWRTKTAWFETEVAKTEDLLVTNQFVMPITEIDLNSLFFTRSYLSTLLLTSNQTIYSRPISFLQHRAQEFEVADLLRYQEDLSQQISLEELPGFISEEVRRAEAVYDLNSLGGGR